jgi:hypothetical protein
LICQSRSAPQNISPSTMKVDVILSGGNIDAALYAKALGSI